MIPSDLYSSFRAALIRGEYNLLLGSGISLDSHNGLGENIRGAEQLRIDICALKTLRPTTSLPRAYSALTATERKQEIVERFSKCRPAASLGPLPSFVWRRLFTFNIDDVLEVLYDNSTGSKQTLVPINYNSPFEPTPSRDELLAVHLHGWVGDPDSGFVFSHAEYARVMASMNPWMHILTEILSTEAFIIAGTSLDEVDLEYYLSHRTEATPRRGRGPSLLIDPYQDAATESDCRRYGLTPVKATFAEFLNWLRQEFPAPPSLADLLVPDLGRLFPDTVTSRQMLKFFTDFRQLNITDENRPSIPTSFLYGHPPQDRDISQHLDIPRTDISLLEDEVDEMLLNRRTKRARLLLVLDEPGAGKSTCVMRVGHNLARRGQPVLAVHTLARIDIENAIKCAL